MIKYHAQFLLDKEKDNPTAKLRYRIKWSGFIVAFNVGYRIEVNKWSKETQRCKINTTHGDKKVPANVINRKIQRYEEVCENIFTKFNAENKIPTADEFRIEFNKGIGKNKRIIEDTLFSIFDKFIKEESEINQWAFRTKLKMQGLKKHLQDFDIELSLSQLNEEKLSEFQLYLQNELKHKNSTISKIISSVKWFLKWAVKKGYMNNSSFELFKPKLKSTQKKIIFLTQSELEKFKNFTIPENKTHLEKIRDIFLFQCYTGLRFSDVINLKRNDIKDGYIEITTIKTVDNLIIELNKHSKSILDKYLIDKMFDEKIFPTISNQKMNDYLKEFSELAGIDEPIRETYYRGGERIDEVLPKYALMSTHAGRRTFICNALSLGIPPQVVMKWTGHSDYKAMKPYIDIADETKISAMERFNLL